MERRRFIEVIAGGIVAAPLAAEAQQPGKMHRIGVLWLGSREASAPFAGALDESLRQLGYVESRNIVIERRFADGQAERLPSLAAELVRLNVDVIVASANPMISTAKQSTNTIPVVMAQAADPVGQGYIASLARPGGNITGLAWDPTPEIFGKSVELLMDVVTPRLSRLAGLVDPAFPANQPYWKETSTAARSRGVTLQYVEVRAPGNFPAAFADTIKERAAAVIILPGPFLYLHRRQIAESAARNRLPTIFPSREGPEAGGLMSYGANLLQAWPRGATYIDRLLKGAKPAISPSSNPPRSSW